MLHSTFKRLATGAAVAVDRARRRRRGGRCERRRPPGRPGTRGPGAVAQTNEWVAAEARARPDDRATHGPGAIDAAQRDVVLRPDDRADRRLPNDAPVTQPTTGEGFDWIDAGIGSAATLGLVLLVAGASVMRLRHQTQTA